MPIHQPLVSIVIVTYNYGKYISDAIQSALAQTYPNCEVLIVDDGSSDNTSDVVRRFGNKVTYYYKQNGGVSSARNYGFAQTKGAYVVYLDSDDKLDATYVAQTLSLLETQPQSVGFVYTQQKSFGTANEVSSFPAYNLNTLRRRSCINVCSLFRRETLAVSPWNETLALWEDWNFYLTLAEHGISGTLLDKPLLLYRKHAHDPSASDNVQWEKMVDLYHYTVNHHPLLYSRKTILVNNMWYRLHKLVPMVRYRKPLS